MLSQKLLTFQYCLKGQNLVCNELAMLKILDNVSETPFNVLDKVCFRFGVRQNSTPDSELTDQNLSFLEFDLLIVYAFVMHE